MKPSLMVVVVTTLVAVALHPVAASTICAICATGQSIGSPNKNVTIPGYPTLTCAQVRVPSDKKTNETSLFMFSISRYFSL
jgi:hypothetical protein